MPMLTLSAMYLQYTKVNVMAATTPSKNNHDINECSEYPDYEEMIYKQSGATLESCFNACRQGKHCKYIAYAAIYTEYIFFNARFEKTHLIVQGRAECTEEG
jgi:hypothetical protein